jgi:hypothetical protein
MAISQTQTQSPGQPATEPQVSDVQETVPQDVASHLFVDDLETPLAEREAVSYSAVMASDIDAVGNWNYVAVADHVTEDRSVIAFIRAVDPAAAACRASTWLAQTRLDWNGNPMTTDLTVYEHGEGRREAPGGGDW